VLEDARSSDPVERLLEDSWEARSRTASRKELAGETIAALLFLAVAVPLAVPAFSAGHVRPGVAALLVGLFAVAARAIRFPLGAGSVVPSYLVLVPMLLLLPPRAVPMLAAAGLVLGSLGRLLAHRAKPQELLFSVADAWHTLAPAGVLLVTGYVHGSVPPGVYAAAFVAGGLVDLASSSAREWMAAGIAPPTQLRVIAVVWLVDACMGSLGLLVAGAARRNPAELLLLLPAFGLLVGVDRDRTARIEQAQHRLTLVARERTRLQAAVQRMGDAFAAKLDLRALSEVVLKGSLDALDADAGRLVIDVPGLRPITESTGPAELHGILGEAVRAAHGAEQPTEIARGDATVIALPFPAGDGGGVLALARRVRAFGEDEQALMRGLVERAQVAVSDILAHEALREQALSDPLTRLGNRRRLAEDLTLRLLDASAHAPLVLMLFDLNGFKTYNDTFGHVAGDALLARLGKKLRSAVSPQGTAYRLGGDEFCVLMPAEPTALHDTIAAAVGALEERGEKFAISASCGTVLLPHEATTADYALQLADERMYAHKHGRPSGAREQAQDVLAHIMRAQQPGLPDEVSGVGQLALRVARRLGMAGEQLDELARAAALHDVGKVGVPDAILSKPGPLDPQEWSFMRQHTVLGERILSAAPALRPVATIVRATHERWDGGGYPDGLRGEAIPLAARIVAVCDAYDAMRTDRCYRPAHSLEVAREELRRAAGTQFDPQVVEAFLIELDEHQDRATAGRAEAAEERAVYAAEVAARITLLLEQPR
jgi:diguanylate cyclase (GGDEF)-like protein